MNNINPLRLLIKALVLFAAANFLFIGCRQFVFNDQVYNHLVKGRSRILYAQPELELIAHSVSVYEEMDAMFGAHILSSVPNKPADEFRVFFIGDSSIWGAGLPPEASLPGQINSMHLTTCRNQHVVAYNLAFPSMYVMKDLLILKRAARYNPDLVVWGVTLKALENSDVNASLFLPSDSNNALSLIEQYRLNIPVGGLKSQTIWDHTLISERSILKKLIQSELDALPWLATGIDYDTFAVTQIRSENDIPENSVFMNHSTKVLPSGLLLGILNAGSSVANGAPVLVVNEPIFIAAGKNSDRFYDDYYSRQTYDQYLKIMSVWAHRNNQPYFDAWNILPSSVFTNTPLHLSVDGEAQLANRLVPEILKLSCP
jgi:hypothetical protein